MGLGIMIAQGGQVDEELGAADYVEVVERAGQPTTYRIRLAVNVLQGDITWLRDSRVDPGAVLSILVPVGDKVHCLVKGPVRSHKVHLVHGGAESYLEVEGSDTTVLMDRENKAAVWDSVSDSEAVTAVLSPYGYLLNVDTTSSRHEAAKHTLVQRETDYRFVQRLARRSGFLFWVQADEAGIEMAYFKRPALEGEAETELTINLESPSFQSLDLVWDVEKPTSAPMAQLDLNTKEAIDGTVTQSPLAGLAGQRLADIVPETRTLHLAAPVDDAGDLSARAEGALIEAEWFVRIQGQTSLHALGSLVRTHTVVELQGVGTRHSGKYFVGAVKHTISATGHTMDVELWRNGWEA